MSGRTVSVVVARGPGVGFVAIGVAVPWVVMSVSSVEAGGDGEGAVAAGVDEGARSELRAGQYEEQIDYYIRFLHLSD